MIYTELNLITIASHKNLLKRSLWDINMLLVVAWKISRKRDKRTFSLSIFLLYEIFSSSISCRSQIMIFLKGKRRFLWVRRQDLVPYLINLPTSIYALYFIHLTQLDETIKKYLMRSFFFQVIFGTSQIYILIPRTQQKATFHEVSNRAQLYSTTRKKCMLKETWNSKLLSIHNIYDVLELRFIESFYRFFIFHSSNLAACASSLEFSVHFIVFVSLSRVQFSASCFKFL